MKIYAIYDKKGELMNPPFTQQNNAMAIRQFQTLVNQPSTAGQTNILHNYAGDFSLYYLGEFEEKSCKFTQEWPIVLLADADELLTPAD